MDYAGIARGIVSGLKTFASGDAREALETIDHGLETVDRGVRVVNSVLDTVERGVGIGRDILSGLHQAAGAGEKAGSAAPPQAEAGAGPSCSRAPDPEEGVAAKRDALLRALRQTMEFDRLCAVSAERNRQTQALLGLSRTHMDSQRKLTMPRSSQPAQNRPWQPLVGRPSLWQSRSDSARPATAAATAGVPADQFAQQLARLKEMSRQTECLVGASRDHMDVMNKSSRNC